MSTVALECPECGKWLRVAAQASEIQRVSKSQLRVEFDAQTVFHTCEEKS